MARNDYFSGMKSKKEPSTSPFPFSLFHSVLIIFLYTITQNCSIITKTLYTITETLILSRKLTGSFRVCIRILPDSIDFCVIVQKFPCEYPSFRDNIRVLPTSINYQAKEPQNNRSYPANAKMPLKAHKNNVTFKAM